MIMTVDRRGLPLPRPRSSGSDVGCATSRATRTPTRAISFCIASRPSRRGTRHYPRSPTRPASRSSSREPPRSCRRGNSANVAKHTITWELIIPAERRVCLPILATVSPRDARRSVEVTISSVSPRLGGVTPAACAHQDRSPRSTWALPTVTRTSIEMIIDTGRAPKRSSGCLRLPGT